MNANELMLGDWVQIVPDAPIMANEYHRIDWIRTGEVGLDNRKIVTYPYIQPIPLTPEILEKNGFENDFYEEESVADYHTIRLEGYSLKHNIGEIDEYLITWCNGGVNVTTDWDGCVQKEISFVHELQHAMRLCGIEKEIEL